MFSKRHKHGSSRKKFKTSLFSIRSSVKIYLFAVLLLWVGRQVFFLLLFLEIHHNFMISSYYHFERSTNAVYKVRMHIITVSVTFI